MHAAVNAMKPKSVHKTLLYSYGHFSSAARATGSTNICDKMCMRLLPVACRMHGIIVLRPREFQEHAPHFIISCKTTSSSPAATESGHAGGSAAAPAVLSCWPVPHHLQDGHWTAVLRNHADQLSQQQLVLPGPQSQLLHVLSKFEDPAFIHAYMPGRCSGLLSGTWQAAGQPKKRPKTTGKGPRELPAQGHAAAGMTWHLPRCGLTFELQADGSIASQEHMGYNLSTEQLLVERAPTAVHYTLPEFHQYLVLQDQQRSVAGPASADRSSKLVLLPSGRVAVQRREPGSTCQAASVHVQLSKSCNAAVQVSLCLLCATNFVWRQSVFQRHFCPLALQPVLRHLSFCPMIQFPDDAYTAATIMLAVCLQVFKYSVHGRFGYLQAPCNTSRLQLAALYAASSTLLPEPGSQLTGAATAMQLVRHSWTNEPLSPQQLQHLQDVSSLGGFLAPALRLLAHDLVASAGQLQHLHVPETGAGAAARRAGSAPASTPSSSTSTAAAACLSLSPDAVSEYLLQAHKPAPSQPALACS